VSTTFDVVDNDQNGPALFNSHIDAAMNQIDRTFTWELSVKIFDDSYVDTSSLPVTLTNGKEMGFSIAYCDNDGSPSRENFIGSKYLPENESNNSYINASLFGTLTLIDPNAEPDAFEPVSFRENEEIKLYPNPASEYIYYWLDRKPNHEIKYRIINLTGQIISYGKIDSGTQGGSIDLRTVEKGIYSINFITDTSIITRSIIVL
jgi:hypothetical protein